MHFLHIASFIQFSFLENIPEMPGNNGLVTTKQADHIGLCKPKRVFIQTHINRNAAIIFLINQNVVAHETASLLINILQAYRNTLTERRPETLLNDIGRRFA